MAGVDLLPYEDSPERLDEIRIKRIGLLMATYDGIAERWKDFADGTHFSPSLVRATVENYLQDRRVLKCRYKICGKIQRHKVAGLMAASIMKYRPVQLVDDDGGKATRLSRDNEIIAIYNGLAICSEGAAIGPVFDKPNYSKWLSDAIYVLSRAQNGAEAFMQIFETLSLEFFPDNFGTCK